METQTTSYLTDVQFRMMLNLSMVSDPWLLTEEERECFIDLLTDEASCRDYQDWIEAYHEFKLGKETSNGN